MQCMLFIKINKEIKYPLECLNIAIKHVKGFFFFFFHFQYISRELLTSNINVFLSTYDVMKLDQNEKKKYFLLTEKKLVKIIEVDSC